jgi:formylglycine-generating enzyme
VISLISKGDALYRGSFLANAVALSSAALLTVLLCANCFAETATSAVAADDMVAIPSGHFIMGSTPEDSTRDKVEAHFSAREYPAHDVTIASFRLAAHDVTRAQFAAFIDATGYVADNCNVFDGFKWAYEASANWRNPGFAQTDRDPVVCVSFEDAKAYVAWYSRTTHKAYRLPSEAEWEYAARAGSVTSRYWGDDIARQCLYANGSSLEYSKAFPQEPDVNRTCSDRFVYTSPVGSFRANPWGLYDMIGDVWQWTADCTHKNYAGAPTDGRAWTTGNCKYHRNRGGSWYDGPWLLRSATRNGTFVSPELPNGRYNGVGFRLAMTTSPAAKTPTQELLDTDRALAAQSIKIGFVAAYSKAMGPDAVKLDQGSQPAIGSKAILAQMATYSKHDVFSWTPEQAVVATSGDLGYTWGRWTDTYRHKNGTIAHVYGKYLDVWRRAPDGKWRWIVDTGNDNPAPPAARRQSVPIVTRLAYDFVDC